MFGRSKSLEKRILILEQEQTTLQALLSQTLKEAIEKIEKSNEEIVRLATKQGAEACSVCGSVFVEVKPSCHFEVKPSWHFGESFFGRMLGCQIVKAKPVCHFCRPAHVEKENLANFAKNHPEKVREIYERHLADEAAKESDKE